MSYIPKKIINQVKKKTLELFSTLQNFEFLGMTAAIEKMRGCSIEIKKKPTYATTCLMTCDEYVLLTKQKEMSIESAMLTRRHFIFCRERKLREYEAFTIAHELGHIYLHWPLKENAELYYQEILNNKYDTYLVKFNLTEEREADVFGCILTSHLFPSGENVPQHIDDIKLYSMIREYGKRRFLQSVRFKTK